ncbi:nuclear transport factor 2 family protein [Bradyrhizobium sp. 41S5]|uniref:nuclear transport factor 2 family protein n=1 Tax=Bradyrhizobium sp. 41S5 TaxID=1404443 RepID=UPI00156B931D|nr:nuclear transport factor 2 family protein [Bradyrhizobium sp. 41S5]UFX47585.1 nuclear transport factor 2 family protein [Bradyrhizobium sp. 41S5]
MRLSVELAPIGIAKKLYAAYDNHDPDTIRELYREDATHDEVSQLRTKRGVDEIVSGMQKLFSWLPDVRWEVKAMVGGEDGAVATFYTMHATAPRKDSIQLAKAISLRGVQLVKIEGGLIRRSEDYWDAATLQRQLS